MSNKQINKLNDEEEIYNLINNSNVTTLKIYEGNIIINDVTYLIYEIRYLYKVLETNNTIEKLIISCLSKDDREMQLLKKTLMANKTIKKIKWSHYWIIDEVCANEMKYLSDALKINKEIIELNLDENQINDQCVEYLCEAIEINNTIQKINLEHNKISDKGIKYLYKILQVNNAIQELNLGSNGIGDEGVEHLCKALEINNTVTKINLNYNLISSKGGRYLVELLKVNNKILDINIGGNVIRKEIRIEIKHCLNKNKNMHNIEKMHKFNIEKKITNEFKKACKDNNTSEALLLINKYKEKVCPLVKNIKASDNIDDQDAIYWILKNKMAQVAKEMIIKCNIIKKLYERGTDIENLIENN